MITIFFSGNWKICPSFKQGVPKLHQVMRKLGCLLKRKNFLIPWKFKSLHWHYHSNIFSWKVWQWEEKCVIENFTLILLAMDICITHEEIRLSSLEKNCSHPFEVQVITLALSVTSYLESMIVRRKDMDKVILMENIILGFLLWPSIIVAQDKTSLS